MKIGIAGCLGRMGIALMKQVMLHPTADLVSGSIREDHRPRVKKTLEDHNIFQLNMPFLSDVEEFVASCDLIIDFTTREYSLALAEATAKQKKMIVCGTTGFTDEEMARYRDYAAGTPMLWSPNMSLGVNIVAAITERIAAKLDAGTDIEIVEMHHRYKADAPSGTALLLGEAAARGRGVDLNAQAVKSRKGHTGPRKEGTIGFATLRGGDVIGDHTVMFAGESERIELTHKATDRNLFAKGAVHAAFWLKDQPSGLHHMRDIIEI